MHHKELNYFKKKKNRALIILSFSFLVLLVAIILILSFNLIDNELVMTLYFLSLIGYLVLIVYLRSKLIVYVMNYHYYKMIHDDLGLINIKRKIYTNSWLNQFKNDGFKKGYENNDHLILYQFFKKLPNLGRTGYVLIAFVVSKKENYNFYDNDINKYLEAIYANYEYERRVKKQIIIQFKKYDRYDASHKDELQEIINYKNGDQVVINMPVGYFVSENQAYYLRPKGKFYNKFHFYTSKLIETYVNVRGDE